MNELDKTKIVAVVGHPIKHSLMPTMFNAAFKHLGMNWKYIVLEIPPQEIEEEATIMKLALLEGFSVTMPYKEHFFHVSESRTISSKRIKAVNCVRNLEGKWIAGNTDQVSSTIKSMLGKRIKEAPIAIIGAGGAGRALAVDVCANLRKDVSIFARNVNKVEAIMEDINNSFAHSEEFTTEEGHHYGRCKVMHIDNTDIFKHSVIINATPLGMQSKDKPPLDTRFIAKNHLIIDLIYHPAETNLIKSARAQGAKAINGLEILAQQAIAQFPFITKRPAPAEVMRKSVGLKTRAI